MAYIIGEFLGPGIEGQIPYLEFYVADDKKGNIFIKIKSKLFNLCKICTRWNYNSSDCLGTFVCKKCEGPDVRNVVH